MAVHSPFEQFSIIFDVVVLVVRSIVRSQWQVPVLIDAEFAALVECKRMPWHELAYAGVKGFLPGEVTKGEKLRQHVRLKFGLDAGISENHLDFRPEQEVVRCKAVIEGLDAQAVASNEQAPAFGVPDGKGKHATQMLNAVFPVFLVEVDYGFGVALRTVRVPASKQLFAQGAMVVDFSVKNYPQCPVFIAERLMAGCEVDDAEPAHPDAHPALRVNAIVIGAAVGHDVAHTPQDGGVCRSTLPEFNNSCYSAHADLVTLSRLCIRNKRASARSPRIQDHPAKCMQGHFDRRRKTA